MFCKVLTTDQPAISAVALNTSTTAYTCSFFISTLCLSPVNCGVDSMVTCKCSGPTVASDAATATFNPVG